jgi:hypothetical protein
MGGLLFISSCIPQATPPATQLASGSETPQLPTETATYQEPQFPLSGNFLQESGLQTQSYLSLPLNFSDSFLIRGLEVSKLARSLPISTKLCIVGKFNYLPGSERILALSAKIRSFTDFSKKTTEFYLQVEPNNEITNQTNCSYANLVSALIVNSTQSLHFGLVTLCSNCNTSVTSDGLVLYLNGSAVSGVNLSSLMLTLSGSSNTSGNSCSENTLCKSRGFDCCIDNICVKDGSYKPGSITSTNYQTAITDVASNPNRFILYPDIYFICPNRPASTGSSVNYDPIDPNYEAQTRLMELRQIYECLNQNEDEFSHCTVKFTNFSAGGLPRTVSASDLPFGQKGDINFSDVNTSFIPVVPYQNNFSGNSIFKISYGGKVYYEAFKTALNNLDGYFQYGGNNDLLSSQSVTISKKPTAAYDDNLYLTYRVDGTCTAVGASLAKCTKKYFQGVQSNPYPKSTDSIVTNSFKVPFYADLTSSVIVKINDVVIPEDSTTWSSNNTSKTINFITPPFTNQKIEITYFVTNPVYVAGLTDMRKYAQDQVRLTCMCGSSNCNLKPKYSETNNIIDYECVYPSSSPDVVPVNQTILLSSKNVPHRFFDTNGVAYDESYSNTGGQEGNEFNYVSNHLLRPNNANSDSTYVGFNEIYGSFSASTDAARPAKMVRVKKDKVYDLFVNSGSFSSCVGCGNDYFTSIQRLFPQNFVTKGGGYTPDLVESRRENSTSMYRSDDLLFGRACFVPASMIPWTHVGSTSVSTQRSLRLAGQHFLFANGYNRDWYGFDYGALIGSFDGVSWFAIGNQRRIKAKSNKLFLAINAYFGDQTLDNTFSVSVSEITPYSPSISEHDTTNDGAECQKAHFCNNDDDCFRRLGYDYSCQNVTGITTEWPNFDLNASEITGSSTRSLSSIIGGTNGQSKRCVYRGRGAPCHANIATILNNFNQTGNFISSACSSNNYCQSINTASPVFNNKIARYANSAQNQNIYFQTNSLLFPTIGDTLGLGTRLIGRPFDYFGSTSIPTLAKNSLFDYKTTHKVEGICIPGKNISAAINSTTEFNSNTPAIRTGSSDKIHGIGPTMAGTGFNDKYLMACPAQIKNSTGIAQSGPFDINSSGATYETFKKSVINQNLSSNLLDFSPINSLILQTGATVSGNGYLKNTCLRAPGASCFADMDCAPSSFIASKVRSASSVTTMNSMEKKYWEEELICSNSDYKYTSPGVMNPDYNINKNVCCRDTGKKISVHTDTTFSGTNYWCQSTQPKVAGVNINLNDSSRYSRVHTAYDRITCDPSQVSASLPYALSTNATSFTNAWAQIKYQYKTLDTVNSRTCCTTHWVRSFDSTNGGGHRWSMQKFQNIDKKIFRNINWMPNSSTSAPNGTAFQCNSDPLLAALASCEIRDFNDNTVELYSNFMGSLELVGIPQVSIPSTDLVKQIVDDNQNDAQPLNLPIKNTLPLTTPTDFSSGANNYYSAANPNLLNTMIKKVFSENEFNCCIPTNQEVPSMTTADQCCTGNLSNVNGPLRCCLPDYTNITVYLNRYVSSEGRGLPETAYDPVSGFIKDPGTVQLIAVQKNLCCSGKVALGSAIGRLPIPSGPGSYVPYSQNLSSVRFVDDDNITNDNSLTGFLATKYNRGVRWNTHVYCVPQSYE